MELELGVKAILQYKGPAEDYKDKILFLKRSRKYTPDNVAFYWTFPGGRINFGEEPLEGLEREVLHETGLHISDKVRILDASPVFIDENKQIVRITYHCIIKDNVVKLDGEHTDYRFLTREEGLLLKPKDRRVNEALIALPYHIENIYNEH